MFLEGFLCAESENVVYRDERVEPHALDEAAGFDISGLKIRASTLDDEAGIAGNPAVRVGAQVSVDPEFTDRGVTIRADQEGDVAVAQVEQVLCQAVAAQLQIRHHGIALESGVIGRREHDRDTPLAEDLIQGEFGPRQLRRDYNYAIDALAYEILDYLVFLPGVVSGHRQDERESVLPGVLIDIARQTAKKWIFDIRDDQADGLRPVHRKTPRNVIRHVAQLGGDAQDLFSSLFLDPRAIIEHQGSSRSGNACFSATSDNLYMTNLDGSALLSALEYPWIDVFVKVIEPISRLEQFLNGLRICSGFFEIVRKRRNSGDITSQ